MNISQIKKILFLVLVDAFAVKACLNGSDCPRHLPYCTPVGCVHSCPNNTFLNESTCVQDCGSDFIFNNKCWDRCPLTHPFVMKRVLASQLQFYALNYCLEKCPQNEYTYQQTCLEECPFDHFYVLERACNIKCPTTHAYYRNQTKDGRLVAIECLLSCDYPTSIKRGQMCVQQCEPPFYLYKKECLDACPEHTRLLYTTNNYGDKTVACKDSCPHGRYVLNDTCQNRCPSNYSIYNNSVCVEACPHSMPYIVKTVFSIFDFVNHPVKVCVNNCPYESYIDDGRCTSVCSGEKKIFNSTCVDSCPQDMPVYDSKGFCKTDCSSYFYGNMCVDECPSDSVLVNTSCESYCPPSVPFVCDRTSEPRCNQNINEMDVPVRKCLRNCPNKTYIDNGRCTSKCSGEKKIFNNTCVDSCPSHQPYLTKTLSNYYRNQNYKCVSQCPITHVLENSTCVNTCSTNMYALESNRTCTTSCPFPEYVIKDMQCLTHCPNPWYNESGKCVATCAKHFVFNNTCVDHCPYSYPLLEETAERSKKWHCRVKCKKNWFTRNGTCVRECPEKAVFNGSCVTQCPDAHPYFRSKNNFNCVKACDKDQITRNKTCIPLTDCKDIIYNNECLQKCPYNTFWTYSSKVNILGTCTQTAYMYFLLVLSILMCILWFFCFWKYFTTTESSSYLFRLICCVGLRKEVQDEDLWSDDNVDSEDETKDNDDKNGTDTAVKSNKRSIISNGNGSEMDPLLLQDFSDEETEHIHLLNYEPNDNNVVFDNVPYDADNTNTAYGNATMLLNEPAVGEILSNTLGGGMGCPNGSLGTQNNQIEVKVVIENI